MAPRSSPPTRAASARPTISLGDAFFIGGLIGQLGYDRSNSLLDPTRGFRLLGPGQSRGLAAQRHATSTSAT